MKESINKGVDFKKYDLNMYGNKYASFKKENRNKKIKYLTK